MLQIMESIVPKKRAIIANIIILTLFFFALYRYRTSLCGVYLLIRESKSEILIEVAVLSAVFFVIESYVYYKICITHNSDFRYRDGLQVILITSFFRLLTLGSGGMPAKVYCCRKKGLQVGDATGVWLIQYLFYKLAVVILGVFSMALFPEMINDLPVGTSIVMIGIIISLFVVILLTAVAVNPKIPEMCYKKYKKNEDQK